MSAVIGVFFCRSAKPVLALAISFRPTLAPFLALPYAALEGLVLGGMSAVLSEMRDGGKFADLRRQFNNALETDLGLARAYDKASAALRTFDKDRSSVQDLHQGRPRCHHGCRRRAHPGCRGRGDVRGPR